MVTFANQIWRRAGIEWAVESVFTEHAPNAALLDQLIAGTAPRTRFNLMSIAPPGRILTAGWNLFMIRDFGSIGGGVFYTELSGVILAERGFGYELPANGRGGGTLAHELGHSLGLPHVPCDSTRNIMALGCSTSGVISSLTSEQVAIARRQAAVGRASSETFETRP